MNFNMFSLPQDEKGSVVAGQTETYQHRGCCNNIVRYGVLLRSECLKEREREMFDDKKKVRLPCMMMMIMVYPPE